MILPRTGDMVHVFTTSLEKDWRGLPFRGTATRYHVRSAPNAQVREFLCLWLGILGPDGKPLNSDQRRTVIRALDAGRDPTQHVTPIYGVVWTAGPKQELTKILFDNDVTEVHVLESAGPRQAHR